MRSEQLPAESTGEVSVLRSSSDPIKETARKRPHGLKKQERQPTPESRPRTKEKLVKSPLLYSAMPTPRSHHAKFTFSPVPASIVEGEAAHRGDGLGQRLRFALGDTEAKIDVNKLGEGPAKVDGCLRNPRKESRVRRKRREDRQGERAEYIPSRGPRTDQCDSWRRRCVRTEGFSFGGYDQSIAIAKVYVESDDSVLSGRSGTVRMWETALRL